jgi:hypothetical protein
VTGRCGNGAIVPGHIEQHSSAQPAALISAAHEPLAPASVHDAVSAAAHAVAHVLTASQQALHGLAGAEYVVHGDALDGHTSMQWVEGAQIAEAWNVPPSASQPVWSANVPQAANTKTIPSQQGPGVPGGATQLPVASQTRAPATIVPPGSAEQRKGDSTFVQPLANSQHTPVCGVHVGAAVAVAVAVGVATAAGHVAGAWQSLSLVICCGLPF